MDGEALTRTPQNDIFLFCDVPSNKREEADFLVLPRTTRQHHTTGGLDEERKKSTIRSSGNHLRRRQFCG
jgi:hypothetical protein